MPREMQDCTMGQTKLLLETPGTNTRKLRMHQHPQTLPGHCCTQPHCPIPTSSIKDAQPPWQQSHHPYQPAPAPQARTALCTFQSPPHPPYIYSLQVPHSLSSMHPTWALWCGTSWDGWGGNGERTGPFQGKAWLSLLQVTKHSKDGCQDEKCNCKSALLLSCISRPTQRQRRFNFFWSCFFFFFPIFVLSSLSS